MAADVNEGPLPTDPVVPPLLALLRQVPAIPAVSTLLFCPKSLARRFSKILLARFTGLFDAIDRGALPEELELHARLLTLTSLLILTAPASVNDPDTLTERDISRSTRQEVKGRLLLAETEQWEPLVLELVRGCQEVRPFGGETGSDRRSPLRKLEHALAKVRSSSCRSAAQILLGPGALTASEATASATLELFRAAPLHSPDSSSLPLDRKAPRVSLKASAVNGRVYRMQAAAQPGASGLRPWHLRGVLLLPGGATALRQWCHRFCNTQLPAAVVKPLLVYLSRPLDKGGGE